MELSARIRAGEVRGGRHCGRALLGSADPSSIHLVEAAHPRAAKLEAILAAEPSLEGCIYDLDDRSITKQVTEAAELAGADGQILVSAVVLEMLGSSVFPTSAHPLSSLLLNRSFAGAYF